VETRTETPPQQRPVIVSEDVTAKTPPPAVIG